MADSASVRKVYSTIVNGIDHSKLDPSTIKPMFSKFKAVFASTFDVDSSDISFKVTKAPNKPSHVMRIKISASVRGPKALLEKGYPPSAEMVTDVVKSAPNIDDAKQDPSQSISARGFLEVNLQIASLDEKAAPPEGITKTSFAMLCGVTTLEKPYEIEDPDSELALANSTWCEEDTFSKEMLCNDTFLNVTLSDNPEDRLKALMKSLGSFRSYGRLASEWRIVQKRGEQNIAFFRERGGLSQPDASGCVYALSFWSGDSYVVTGEKNYVAVSRGASLKFRQGNLKNIHKGKGSGKGADAEKGPADGGKGKGKGKGKGMASMVEMGYPLGMGKGKGEDAEEELEKFESEMSPITYYLVRALMVLPSYWGVVTRMAQLGKEDLALYKPGHLVTWFQWSSCKKGTGAASSFADKNTKFVIWSISGRCIDDFSNFGKHLGGSEDEVLLLPGARFLVLAVKQQAKDDVEVHMRQVELGITTGLPLLWVDDHILKPEKEMKREMDMAQLRRQQDHVIKFICKPRTDLAVAFLKSPWGRCHALNPASKLRILSDMGRDNEDDPSTAGARLVRDVKTDKELAYECPMLIFCMSVGYAKSKLKEFGVETDAEVTAAKSKAIAFAAFDATVQVGADIDSEKFFDDFDKK